ncbi:MAG TPA: hypothetical protein VK177_21545 [Flavobacteriales bacterium]|nr:hypothetical protein [Flavobacteriales bacterium]
MKQAMFANSIKQANYSVCKNYLLLFALAFGLKGNLFGQLNIKDKVKNVADKAKEKPSNMNVPVNAPNNDKILFAAKPFSKGANAQTEFKANTPVYGKIVVGSMRKYAQEIDSWNQQNLKEEGVNKKFTHRILFNLSRATDPDGSNVDVSVYLSEADLDKKELEFDLAPTENDATTYYVESQTFFNVFASVSNMSDTYGSKLTYIVKLKEKPSGNINQDPSDAVANLTIDYSASSSETQTEWRNQQEEIRTATAGKHKNGTVGVAAAPKNQILFGSKPFSKSPAPFTTVKAGTPVYGRLVLPKPLKEYASNSNAGKKLCFTVLVKIKGVYEDEYKETCNMMVTAADLSKKEIDFDMAAMNGDASTQFEEGKEFYRYIATNAYYGDGAIVDYKILLDQESNSDFTINGEGLLQVDYSANDYDKALAWYQQCMNANNGVVEKAEKAGVEAAMNNVANKMVFASQPFSKNPQPQTDFKAGTPIYGKLTLEKPLKDYCKPLEKDLVEYYKADKDIVRVLEFTISIKKGEGEYEQMPLKPMLFLSQADIEKKEIEFDITPANGESASRYASFEGFYRSFASEYDIDLGGKINFKITLNDEMNQAKSEIHGLEGAGDLTIDYSASTKATQKAWFEQGVKEEKAARLAALKKVNKASVEQAKSLPLPLCFSKGNNPGYSDARFSNANLINMIKQHVGATEIMKLTFDKADGSGDFRSLVDASTNFPSYKMGNHVFYWAFKDSDGTYRFSGGVIKMDYVGNGVYGDPYIYNYSPIQNNDPSFPLDVVRDDAGSYGVFIFDGSKLK